MVTATVTTNYTNGTEREDKWTFDTLQALYEHMTAILNQDDVSSLLVAVVCG